MTTKTHNTNRFQKKRWTVLEMPIFSSGSKKEKKDGLVKLSNTPKLENQVHYTTTVSFPSSYPKNRITHDMCAPVRAVSFN